MESGAVSGEQMRLVLDVSRALAVTTDLNALLRVIAEATCRLLRCEQSSIWLHDAEREELWTKVALGSNEIRVPMGSGIVGACFGGGQVIEVPNAYDDPRFNSASDRASGFRTCSLLAAPMLDFDSQPVGVVEAVNKTGGFFTEEDQVLIRLLADQAGVAIQRNRLQVAAEQTAELQREIQLARRVQVALLPAEIPKLPGFDVAAWAKPASTTGGDCYDFWRLRDGRLAIFLADASGHGLAPTLVVSEARAVVRGLCDFPGVQSQPHDIFVRVNQRLSEDLEPNRFVTAFLGFLSEDGLLQWQSAGHGPILWRASATGDWQMLDAPTPPLNAIKEFPDNIPPPLQIGEGGTLAVMSDGIFEAFSPSQELFGAERVMRLLDLLDHNSAERVIGQIHAAVADWQRHDHPGDDQTVVIVNRRG